MRRPLLVLLLTLAVLGLSPAAQSAGQSSGQSTDRSTDRPHQAGRWLLDRQGRVRIDQGVNMVYKQGSYAPDATGFGADDARFLRRNGFTTVRLGLIWKAVEPRPGSYDDDYLDRIAHTVMVLHRHGIVT